MILKKIKTYNFFLIFGFICFAVTGCSSKTVVLEPQVKYGNPSQDHIKDIPQIRYKEESDSAQSESNQGDKLPELNADEYEKLGDAMLSNGKYFIAFMQYENSLKENKGNLRVEYKKGVALLGANKLKEAQKQFQQVLQKKPDFAPAHEGMGRVNFKSRQYHIAKADFKKAVGLDPVLWRSYNYLGNLYDLDKEYDLAVRNYKTAITIRPDKGFLYNNLGVSLYMADKYQDAVESFYKALKLGYASRKIYNNLGRTFVDMELYDKALEAFKKGGSEAVAYNNVGVGLLNSGKTDKAAQYFRKAIELSPQFYVQANENLKKCRLKQK
ncbi:MAG: tetratricopeptide repeat protein [Thermodesulfobacteriota bacterium]